MGLKKPYWRLITFAASYNSYLKAKVALESILNNVQVKPNERKDYIDKSMEIGSIKAIGAVFGVNDKEHLELIKKIINSDEFKDENKDEISHPNDLYDRLKKTKNEIYEKKIKEQKEDIQ